MAQHNTDYGLVYNTDGDLCVTKRTDIVPFPGITSYAVETATTNYWNNDITDYAYNIRSGSVTFENTVYNGRPALKCIVTGTDPFIQIAFKHSAGNINPGDTYTASIGVAALSSEITGLVDTAAYVYFTKSDFGGFLRLDHDWGKAGNRIYATYTRPTDDTTVSFYACVYLRAAGTFYLYDYQLEKKPFASSFVNGSRPNGRLVVPLEKLGFNPATDDWVVHYWKYPVATHTNDLTGYNLCSIGKYTSDHSEGYIWWGKMTGTNVFRIEVVYNDSTVGSVTSPSFDPAWYFRNWHHEVMLKHGNEMQYWVDGIQRIAFTLAKPLLNNFTAGLTVGGSDDVLYPENSYIANLCYGLYTDQWTPEFIQEQAAMTQGYYVPPRKVIE